MATTMSLSDLRTAVRQRADMENASGDYSQAFIKDPELNSYINQSYFELYDLLVQKYGDDYFVQVPPYSFVTDGVNGYYSLPTDFYKLAGVDVQIPGGSNAYYTLKPFSMAERNRYPVPNYQSFYGVSNLLYRIIGDKLWLNPIPAGGQTIRLFYVPKMSTLASDTDTVQGVSGWTEYIICDAAIKCMQKEESDVSVLMNQKAGLIARIESAAENRDVANPATVADSQSNDMFFGNNYGWRL